MNQDERSETWHLWEGARAVAMLKVAVKGAPCLYNAKPHPMVLSACLLGSRVVSSGCCWSLLCHNFLPRLGHFCAKCGRMIMSGVLSHEDKLGPNILFTGQTGFGVFDFTVAFLCALYIPLTISTTKRVNTCLIPSPVSWRIHAKKMESCTGFCSKRACAASCSGVSFST